MTGFRSLRFLVVFVALMGIFACSAIDLQKPAHVFAIQYATGKIIEKGNAKRRAQLVFDEIQEVRHFVDMHRYPLTQVKAKLIQRLIDKNVSPADMLLTNTLISAVEEQIHQGVLRGSIDADLRVRTNAVLNLIEGVARAYL